ncbi:LPD23 domain-containing protein [Stutzerimonas stutzeri]|uniref:ADP-ribosyltransferase-containing protein n=1 Tax=Stutzerimonas stutzeri TaxID=316 RepID=UPI00265D5607|nr:LPD23 domain-containing protein [Stutzerimonas stutzeri]MCF6783714.1 hypothetical protein [Stutzerimonas stutzeri]
MNIAAILRNAAFIDSPDIRSGEALYWHELTGRYIALPIVGASADELLQQHAWKPVRPDQVKSARFDALSALRRLWPELHRAHPAFIAHRLDARTCETLINLQPEEDRGAMGRWLIARCTELEKHDVATATADYMSRTSVRAIHPWATGREQRNQFLLSQHLSSAFLLTGTEATGYTLTTFVTGDSAPRQRDADTITDLLTPNADWSHADWEHYGALLTARPSSEADFWTHPALTKFLGNRDPLAVRHQLIAPQLPESLAEDLRNRGAAALLGERHAALQSRFLNDIPAAWLDLMAGDLGLKLNTPDAYRTLTDCWMALRASYADCVAHILPALREANAEAFSTLSDDELLTVWRSCYQPITDYIRQTQAPRKPLSLVRSSQAHTSLSPASMREVLSAHYGSASIDALMGAGKLHLLADHQDLPLDVRLSSAVDTGSIAGATLADGSVYLIGNRITPDTLAGLFLHEVGEHAGLADMLGPDYGRLTKHFQKLLREKDTYATWAAMRVPASTKPEHVASEQLAYLVERVANEDTIRAGGERGYALGQECLSNLRTWLFRTPLCRWMDEIGALDDFTLTPQDMASLAREAVDFFVEQTKPGTVTTNRNTWVNSLNPGTLDMLYRASPQERIALLEAEGSAQAMGYLYALGLTKAPLIGIAIDHFASTLAVLATDFSKPELQAIAGELLVMQQGMDTQAQLRGQMDRLGFAMWMEGTSDPEQACLHVLSPSADQPDQWQLNRYSKGAGVHSSDRFDSIDRALAQVGATSFIVADAEAPAVLQGWAQVEAVDDQTDSHSFMRWFGASQAADSSGDPLVLYVAKQMGDTWASSLPPEEGDANIAVYVQAERPFDADKLDNTLTLKGFFEQALEQASVAGRTPDAEQAILLMNHIRGCARREESGPYYAASDILRDMRSMFGKDGAESVTALLKLLGFDSIRMTDHEQTVFGVLEPSQMKPAASVRAIHAPGRAEPVAQDPVEALKRWAGNSKVVDANGLPLVVFHGTGVDITHFDVAMSGTGADHNQKGTDAHWFSSSTMVADSFARLMEDPSVMPVFIKLENPLLVDCEQWARRFGTLAEGFKFGEGRVAYDIRWFKHEAIAQARADGHDGVIFTNGYDGVPVEGAINYAVFESSQIKSAIGNRGTYDPSSDDIRLRSNAADTEAFNAWFKQSKIVGADGKPLVVYHGTRPGKEIGSFDLPPNGRDGIYFTPDPQYAEAFTVNISDSSSDAAGAIYPVYLSIQNPFVVEAEDGSPEFEEFVYRGLDISALAAQGYDGAVLNVKGIGVDQIIAFRPEQIKSAIGNIGTFDPSNADIRLRSGGGSQTDTPAFKSWFDGSLAVDENGNPLIVYRGLGTPYESSADPEIAWVTPSAEYAAQYALDNSTTTLEDRRFLKTGANVLPLYVSVKNPFDLGFRSTLEQVRYSDFLERIDTGVQSAFERGLVGQEIAAGLMEEISAMQAQDSGEIKKVHEWWTQHASEVKSLLERAGYDGIKSREGFDNRILAFGVFRPEQIKSAIGNIGTFDPRNADIRFSFAGIGAVTANMETLQKAHELAQSGASPAFIQKETGWHRGVDGRWRFEISDDKAMFLQGNKIDVVELAKEIEPQVVFEADGELIKAKYKPGTADYVGGFGRNREDALVNLARHVSRQTPQGFDVTSVQDGESLPLDQVLYHPDLYAAYPYLANVVIQFRRSGAPEERGAFFEESNRIELNANRTADEILSTLLHEIQHAIQFRENFARGGNSDFGFSESIKKLLQIMSEKEASLLETWKLRNAELLDDVKRTSEVARNALKFESVLRLMAYGSREKPSSVFRLIRNEMQWIYDQEFRGNEAAAELERSFYKLPRRGIERNLFIRDLAYDAAQIIRASIPADQLEQFISDERSTKAMVKALRRQADAASEKLKPLREQQARATSTEHLYNRSRHKSAYDIYRSLAGEVEARTTQARQHLTPEERRNRPIINDMDVSPAEAIVVVGGLELLPPFASDSAPEMTASTAFRSWFSDSKVVDAEGEPLVVYHGTPNDFSQFLPGAYFTEHPAEAAAYTGAGATMARGRMTGKYKAGRDRGASDGAEVRYAYDGLSALESPKVGEIVATDDLAYRYEGGGKWTAFTDLGPDFSAGAASQDYVIVRKGDTADQAAERIAEYEEAVVRATPGGDGGGNVMPVYLSIKNPVRLSALAGNRLAEKAGNDRAYIAEQIAKWEAQGYDGIVTESDEASVIPESREGLGGIPQQWVAFRPEQIKSATGNRGTFNPSNPDIRFSFAGPNAETADQDLLAQAQRRLAAGEDAELVRQDIGWFQGHDKGWRFEIDDSKASLPEPSHQDGEANGEPVYRAMSSLGDHLAHLHPVAAAQLGKTEVFVKGVLDHPQLFAAYPQLSTINVVIERSDGFAFAENGEFRRSTVSGLSDSILIRYNPTRGGSALGALLHEVQHAIQKVEGFARGGSTSEFAAEELVSEELRNINHQIAQLLGANPETASVYRTYNQLRIRANDEAWPEPLTGTIAALEVELLELPGGSELFDLETERFGLQFIDKVAAPFEKYQRLAGEVEARNVQTRLGFDAEQRKQQSPFNTEDIAPDQINVRLNTGSVLAMALQQERAELEAATEAKLDMSREARLARAQAMGFDTSKVWYHGTDKAGFKAFNTDGEGKTAGTGAFLADHRLMASTYTKRNQDAPIFTGQELFNDPDQLEDLEIERYWVTETPSGRIEFEADQRLYDTAEQFIEGEDIELNPGDVVRAAYTIYHEGQLVTEYATEDEAIVELDQIEASQPGIYELYARTSDQLVIDWQGRNWDDGPEEQVWTLYDEDKNVLGYHYSLKEAENALEEIPGSHIAEETIANYLSTDDAARQARDMGYDSVLIQNVYDSGPNSQGDIEADVLVVFDPANLRSTAAAFDPRHSASSNLLFSVTEAPQSRAFDQWFGGSQVCNPDGSPLVVYLGDSRARPGDTVFLSGLGSLGFSDFETAQQQAQSAGDSPRITPAYLSIKRPLVVTPSQPTIALGELVAAIGQQRTNRLLSALGIAHDADVQAIELDRIMANHGCVGILKAAGYDGAVYARSGGQGSIEYRVFDPAQVASGSPMPASTPAPTSSTRMALTKPAPVDRAFTGSAATAEQFRMEQRGVGIPGQYGYGIYLQSAKAVSQVTGISTAINRYANTALTPASIARLRANEAIPAAVRRFISTHSRELTSGQDVQSLLQAHIKTLQARLDDINQAPRNAELERQVKTDLGTLINHMGRFEHVASISSLPSPTDYLSWDATLQAQPEEIRDALALLGIDGYWEVHGGQGRMQAFTNQIEAQAYLERLAGEGHAPSLVGQFNADHPGMPTGGQIYQELVELLGSAKEVSTRLEQAGIRGIRYQPAPSPSGDAPERFVVFPNPLHATPARPLPGFSIHNGVDQPAFPLPITKLPAVFLKGQLDAISANLQQAQKVVATGLERSVQDYEQRQQWLHGLPNAEDQLSQLNRAALARARDELRQIKRWQRPTLRNCLSWSAPLGSEACKRLAPLIRITPTEKITGEAVFHLLAERMGSNKKACSALTDIGLVGAYTDKGVALWDTGSHCLSQKVADASDRTRFHLVAHGSKHFIEEFDTSKIGTGEGVQAFGYGLYFADRKMVASHYQKMRAREGCWYESTFYDHPTDMLQYVEAKLASDDSVTPEMLDAAKHCLSLATWAAQRVEQVISTYPADMTPFLNEVVGGYSKLGQDQLSDFFILPSNGIRGLNAIQDNDDRDYSLGLSYLGSGLHYYLREGMSDEQLHAVLSEQIERQCDVDQAQQYRDEVAADLERHPNDDYLQSRLRDCDYFLRMAQCAQKVVRDYGPFKLHRPLGAGNLYLVDLTNSQTEYLRYDLPFNQQSALVQKAVHAIAAEQTLPDDRQQRLVSAIEGDLMGHDILGALAGRGDYFNAACSEDEKYASELLHAHGVQGIKYPDGLSRDGGGSESFNYVIFDADRAQILGHTDRYLRSEAEEIPLYEWADIEMLDMDLPDNTPSQRSGLGW